MSKFISEIEKLVDQRRACGHVKELVNLLKWLADESGECGCQDDVSRICSGFQAFHGKSWRTAAGWKFSSGNWYSNKGPGNGVRSGWADHCSVRRAPTGEAVYISEPYQILDDDIHQIAALLNVGWSIVIDGRSLHFPGNTVSIAFTRPRTK